LPSDTVAGVGVGAHGLDEEREPHSAERTPVLPVDIIVGTGQSCSSVKERMETLREALTQKWQGKAREVVPTGGS